jgi:hypothetical protein
MKGSLHALQHNEQSIDLMFAPYGPRGGSGTMRPRRFKSYAALADFLREKIGAREDAMQDFLGQLASTHHGTMNEVWLPEEQRLKLGL